MAEQVNQQLKNYLEPNGLMDGSEQQKIRAQEVASVAMTVYAFMDYMFEEIEYTGFQGIEFLAKCELFLKAVTPSYPAVGFNQILQTLTQIDNRFPRTKFFQGFQGLRSLCSGDAGKVIELVNSSGKSHITSTSHLSRDLIFFGTFLIEKVIRMIKEIRALKEAAGWTVAEYRKRIDESYDNCVVQTVMHL